MRAHTNMQFIEEYWIKQFGSSGWTPSATSKQNSLQNSDALSSPIGKLKLCLFTELLQKMEY